MTDFGLDDDIIIEKRRLFALKWHGFIQNKVVSRTGNPINDGIDCTVKDGLGDDSGKSPLNPVTKVTK